MTFAIAGVSGNTGRVAAETLLARGEKVRVVVRDEAKGAAWAARGASVAVADLGDARALAAALRGAKGAYLLVPPSSTATDFRAYQDAISRSLAAAVAESSVPHVVLLSSIGAHVDGPTGPIAGLRVAERLLGDIRGTRLASVRAGYFYENFASTLGAAKQDGVLPSFYPAELSFPMTSTGDIGRLAADLLLEGYGKPVELGTDHRTSDIARVLGTLFGKTVQVAEAPREAVVPALVSAGFSSDLAKLYGEMTDAITNRLVVFEGGHRRVASTEPVEQVFKGLLG